MRQIPNRPWQQANAAQYVPQPMPQSGNMLGKDTTYSTMQGMQNMQSITNPNMAGMQQTQPMMGQATQMPFQPAAESPMQAPQLTQPQTEQTRQFVQEAIMRLHEVFPMCNINSLADLAATAEGRLTLEYWRRGVPLEEAYRVAFGAQLQESQAKAARQQALNDANSKRHLAQPMGQAAGGVRMSAADKAIWREFFPNATDAQLLEKWRKMG